MEIWCSSKESSPCSPPLISPTLDNPFLLASISNLYNPFVNLLVSLIPSTACEYRISIVPRPWLDGEIERMDGRSTEGECLDGVRREGRGVAVVEGKGWKGGGGGWRVEDVLVVLDAWF